MNDPTLLPILGLAGALLLLMFWRLVAGLILTTTLVVFLVGAVTLVVQAHDALGRT